MSEAYQMSKAYAYWLNSVPGIGSKSIEKLLKAYGSPEGVYQGIENCNYESCSGRSKEERVIAQHPLREFLGEKQIESLLSARRTWQVEKEYVRLQERGIGFLVKGEADYPKRLLEIPDAPYGLFYMGKIPCNERLSVAVIGARDCSEYGKYVARELGKYLGERGTALISGMARGIDGIAQEAAMQAGGSSYGILGCGVDICYPRQTRPLYRKLLERGGVLSLYPPGTLPVPSLFPPRNRIVSGLADALVVIEARQKSGTLITVDMALEQGREVYVVPGRVTDRLSDGCNKLLKQGAGVFLSPKDFLEELMTIFPNKVLLNNVKNENDRSVSSDKTATRACGDSGMSGELLSDKLSSNKLSSESKISLEEKEVFMSLDFYPQSVEQIREKLPATYTYHQITGILMQLCMLGEATQAGNGYFMKRGVR